MRIGPNWVFVNFSAAIIRTVHPAGTNAIDIAGKSPDLLDHYGQCQFY